MLLSFVGMVVGAVNHNLVTLVLAAGSAFASGSLCLLLYKSTAFFSAIFLLVPFLLAALAEHQGHSVFNSWWFWTMATISVSAGIAFLFKALARSPNETNKV